jgi:hypothetical protein|tara:strand:- start:187 stop:375 length:189 start_codon:yes stop_codon:yes gene_type:complete
MSEDLNRKIVDQIEAGKLQDAKDSVFDALKAKAAEVVDMKRVETSTTWMDKQPDENLETDNN